MHDPRFGCCIADTADTVGGTIGRAVGDEFGPGARIGYNVAKYLIPGGVAVDHAVTVADRSGIAERVFDSIGPDVLSRIDPRNVSLRRRPAPHHAPAPAAPAAPAAPTEPPAPSPGVWLWAAALLALTTL